MMMVNAVSLVYSDLIKKLKEVSNKDSTDFDKTLKKNWEEKTMSGSHHIMTSIVQPIVINNIFAYGEESKSKFIFLPFSYILFLCVSSFQNGLIGLSFPNSSNFLASNVRGGNI